MKKLLLFFLVLFFIIKGFCQNSSKRAHIDSMISKNRIKLEFKLDSGVIEDVHHKIPVRFYDLYIFDNLSKHLIKSEYRQDSMELITFIGYYYSSDKIIKINYGLSKALGDDGVEDLYQVNYYYENGILIDTLEFTQIPKNIKLLTPDELYKIGIKYLNKYNSELK